MKKPQRHAIVLFAHGSRDPQWAEPMQALQAAVQRGLALKLDTPHLPIELVLAPAAV